MSELKADNHLISEVKSGDLEHRLEIGDPGPEISKKENNNKLDEEMVSQLYGSKYCHFEICSKRAARVKVARDESMMKHLWLLGTECWYPQSSCVEILDGIVAFENTLDD